MLKSLRGVFAGLAIVVILPLAVHAQPATPPPARVNNLNGSEVAQCSIQLGGTLYPCDVIHLDNGAGGFVPAKGDTLGRLHVVVDSGGGGGGGGGGAVSGTVSAGSAGVDPPVFIAGSRDGSGTGIIQAIKVASDGTQFVAGTGTPGTSDARVVTVQGIASGTPMPVSDSSAATTATNTGTIATNTGTTATNTGTTNTDIGAPGATVCATDTGSCALNAQMQRLLQRLSALITATGSPFQAGASIGVTAASNVHSTALETAHVMCSSACHLADFEVQVDSTVAAGGWWVLVLDATTDPGNGAVSPARCYFQPSGQFQMGGTLPTGGLTMTTGAVIITSTTGCLTETQAGSHSYIAGGKF